MWGVSTILEIHLQSTWERKQRNEILLYKVHGGEKKKKKEIIKTIGLKKQILNSSVDFEKKKKVVFLSLFITMERKNMYKKKILVLNFHHIFCLLKKLIFAIMGWNKQANSSGYSWLGFFLFKTQARRLNEWS